MAVEPRCSIPQAKVIAFYRDTSGNLAMLSGATRMAARQLAVEQLEVQAKDVNKCPCPLAMLPRRAAPSLVPTAVAVLHRLGWASGNDLAGGRRHTSTSTSVEKRCDACNSLLLGSISID